MKEPSPPPIKFSRLYERFDQPVTELDCGEKCAPFNSHGKPFCCDICHAVPVAYEGEWAWLERSTDLWEPFRGDECAGEGLGEAEMAALREEIPPGMRLLACLGPARCQRPFRSLSCRQFPFFPYLTADWRFIGLAVEWAYRDVCWVASHLGEVSSAYREAFVGTFDELFLLWPQEMETYADHSAELREFALGRGERFPLLHRDGRLVLVSPGTERMRRVEAAAFPRYGFWRGED